MPVIIDGDLEARKLMNLSLSCDHRVVDGWDAANFLQEMKRFIENPLSCCPDRFRLNLSFQGFVAMTCVSRTAD
jgi:hypothetical protein